jgi:hypothetical protein
MSMLELEQKEGNHSKEFMDASLARKLEVLGKEASDIRLELESRSLLHATFANELKLEMDAKRDEIRQFGGWKYGTIFEDRIQLLEKDIDELRKETRFEELNFWRDVSRLKEIMRRVLKECWQIQSRKGFLEQYVNKLNKVEW